ncbi:MAG TPA: aromatic ring-hydroxylating dioxygenase subunit alpha, partial [Spongiibacteraceae bacterium]|nr:aromatic ring-hydroxylating dioxygenase subunit alpha [Spongiibacteraceae bacterium]
MPEVWEMNEQVKSNIIASEADWPASWRTLSHGISVGRYTDPSFLALEFEKLWDHVWQAAARLDQIPEVGDYTVYDIGTRSVLLVRVDADTIKAYHNVCPHRGTALGEGCGTFEEGRIRCPFHGWRWDLKGQIQYVLEREQFRNGELRDSDVALKEINLAIFAGFIFINFDANPMPFDEFIAPVREVLEGLVIGDMRHYWWKAIPVPANWKIAQEAFFETYHVPETHPQLEQGGAKAIRDMRDDFAFAHRNVVYQNHPHGHGRFFAGKKSPMAGHVNDQKADPVDTMADRLQLLVDGMDAMVLQADVDLLRTLRGKPIPEGSNLGGEYVKLLYGTAAAQGRPMPKPTPEILGMWGGQVFIFPNLMLLPQAGNCMIYRVIPDPVDPNQCTFEIMSTRTLPADVKPTRQVLTPVTDMADPEQVRLIPRQDLGNIPRMQKGLHALGIQQTWLAGEHERMILNMHQEM